MSKTKPIIPRNLRPGDRLWYSETKYAEVKESPAGRWVYAKDYVYAEADGASMNYMLEDGIELMGDTPPISRIERISSAKPGKGKATWAVQVICRSRAHARKTAANIDNGLRKIKIVKLTEAS